MAATPIQFTLARLLHAIAWFAIASALLAAGHRAQAMPTLEVEVLLLSPAIIAFGAGAGAIFGRTWRGALSVAILLWGLLSWLVLILG
jgi:hypothetical protein